jgi:RimJ/RimL family protein N-acetyltransferase
MADLERKNIKRLLAKTSPGNDGSQKVLIKCGFIKGEVIKDGYTRFVDNGVKSDVLCWYLDRPVVG